MELETNEGKPLFDVEQMSTPRNSTDVTQKWYYYSEEKRWISLVLLAFSLALSVVVSLACIWTNNLWSKYDGQSFTSQIISFSILAFFIISFGFPPVLRDVSHWTSRIPRP